MVAVALYDVHAYVYLDLYLMYMNHSSGGILSYRSYCICLSVPQRHLRATHSNIHIRHLYISYPSFRRIVACGNSTQRKVTSLVPTTIYTHKRSLSACGSWDVRTNTKTSKSLPRICLIPRELYSLIPHWKRWVITPDSVIYSMLHLYLTYMHYRYSSSSIWCQCICIFAPIPHVYEL
jgi:hypothetical protein